MPPIERDCLADWTVRSKRTFIEVIGRLVDQGAEGVILGCTEFGMLIGAGDASVPLFDTTVLHARRAVDLALTE